MYLQYIYMYTVYIIHAFCVPCKHHPPRPPLAPAGWPRGRDNLHLPMVQILQNKVGSRYLVCSIHIYRLCTVIIYMLLFHILPSNDVFFMICVVYIVSYTSFVCWVCWEYILASPDTENIALTGWNQQLHMLAETQSQQSQQKTETNWNINHLNNCHRKTEKQLNTKHHHHQQHQHQQLGRKKKTQKKKQLKQTQTSPDFFPTSS